MGAQVSTKIGGTLAAPEGEFDVAALVDAIMVRAYEVEVARLEQLRAEDEARRQAAAEERARLAEEAARKAAEEAAAKKAAEEAAAKAAAEEAAKQKAEEEAAAKKAAEEEALRRALQPQPPRSGDLAAAALVPAQHGDAHGRGEVGRFARLVDFADQCGQLRVPALGHGLKAAPELGLEREAGAVPGDGQRALLQASGLLAEAVEADDLLAGRVGWSPARRAVRRRPPPRRPAGHAGLPPRRSRR